MNKEPFEYFFHYALWSSEIIQFKMIYTWIASEDQNVQCGSSNSSVAHLHLNYSHPSLQPEETIPDVFPKQLCLTFLDAFLTKNEMLHKPDVPMMFLHLMQMQKNSFHFWNLKCIGIILFIHTFIFFLVYIYIELQSANPSDFFAALFETGSCVMKTFSFFEKLLSFRAE